MTTDTDATAARLRDRMYRASDALLNGNTDQLDDWDAALDTLIQYHRSAGAVEAWEDALVALDADKSQKAKDGTIGITVLVHGLRATFERALAAAQARLALLEQGNPAYEEER